MASSPISSWQIDGEHWKQWEALFWGAPKSLQMVTAVMKLKDACSLEESSDKPRQCIKKQRHHFADKGLSSQSYGFSISHVRMWELNHKEGWALKNWCFGIVLENILQSPLNSRKIKPVDPKGNQPWIFTGRTDAEAEAPILRPPDTKNGLIWPWCWERLRAGGEGDDRGWDGWMASPTPWTWVWANPSRLWGTGRPGLLQSMGLQRVRHDLLTEQKQQIMLFKEYILTHSQTHNMIS